MQGLVFNSCSLCFGCGSVQGGPATCSGAVKYKFIKTTFIKKKFIKNQFHQKPLSSKTTFIKNQFHQKPISSKTTFIKKPLSSKNHFHQKTTFIKDHFHQKPFSSEKKKKGDSQYSPCLCEGVAGRRPATPSHKHCLLCPPFGFQQAFMWSIAGRRPLGFGVWGLGFRV